jgi:hypothetical protein
MDVRRIAGSLAAVVVASAASAPAQDTWRVNVDSAGNQALGATGYPPKISGDGRFVVFVSIADGLVAGDSNGSNDVFVHDLQSGTTECVSLDTSGNPAGVSFWGSISDDGRYVAFASNSQTLVASDQHYGTDCFVRDRATGTTELASVATGGTQFGDESYVPVITGDGRFVAMMRGTSPMRRSGCATGRTGRLTSSASIPTGRARTTAAGTSISADDGRRVGQRGDHPRSGRHEPGERRFVHDRQRARPSG